MRGRGLAAAILAAFAAPALSQTPQPAPTALANNATAVAPPIATSADVRIPAGTVVVIELAQAVSSRTQKGGDRFALRLAEPLVIDGKTAIPAGATGYGEVVDAAGGGVYGRPAKLILAAREIDYQGVKITLHGFHMDAAGRDSSHTAVALSAVPDVGLLAILIPGGEVNHPPGTRANAKVSFDVVLPALASAASLAGVPLAPPTTLPLSPSKGPTS